MFPWRNTGSRYSLMVIKTYPVCPMNSEADKAWARLYPYEHSVLELDDHDDRDMALDKYEAFVTGYNTAKATVHQAHL